MDDCLWNLVAREISGKSVMGPLEAREFAKRMGVDLADVEMTLDALGYMEEYRVSRGIANDNHYLREFESAFHEIVRRRRHLSSPGDKLLFGKLAFILLDDVTPRSLSHDIGRLSDFYSHIRGVLVELLPDVPQDDRDDLAVLGHSSVDPRLFILSNSLCASGSAKRMATHLLQLVCT